MVWKRVGSPCHGGCGKGQSGVERQSFHAILLLTAGFGAFRLRRAEEFLMKISRRQLLKAATRCTGHQETRFTTRRFGPLGCRYPPGRRSRNLVLARTVGPPGLS